MYRVWFKILKSDNVTHNINSVKKKSNMIYQLMQEKPLATFKIHPQFKKKKKTLIILSIEKNFLNLRRTSTKHLQLILHLMVK